MAEIGRNQPCPCGSGRKSKRCSDGPSGPSPDHLARVYLQAAANRWGTLLADHTGQEMVALENELLELPGRDVSMQLPLPRPPTPALERLGRAMADLDDDRIRAALPDALGVVDTAMNRERLARALLALHENGHRVGCEATALGLVVLAGEDRTPLLAAALLHAVAFDRGRLPRPIGAHVAPGPPLL